VRLSIVLLLISLAGILGGAALIGLPALGAAVIFDSLCVGVWALARDDGQPDVPQMHGAATLHDVLERFRQAS
jgi:hypothetical protein